MKNIGTFNAQPQDVWVRQNSWIQVSNNGKKGIIGNLARGLLTRSVAAAMENKIKSRMKFDDVQVILAGGGGKTGVVEGLYSLPRQRMAADQVVLFEKRLKRNFKELLEEEGLVVKTVQLYGPSRSNQMTVRAQFGAVA